MQLKQRLPVYNVYPTYAWAKNILNLKVYAKMKHQSRLLNKIT